MRQDIINAARTYTGDGISVTLTDDRKVSVGSWKELQNRLITDDEILERAPYAKGLAIICGAISGNIEVIDIDLKYDISGTLYKRIQEALPDHIAEKLVIARTISKGIHLYYRCASLSGNTKLARRPATDEELKQNPHAKVFVLIETRGEGGYVVAPPSPGYKWLDGDQSSIQTLTEEEREELFTICRQFNEYIEEPSIYTPMVSGSSPLDEYNQRGDIVSLLLKHGWTVNRTTSERVYMTRPGKKEGISGDFLIEKRWFSVFTTSSQFEPNKAYNPASVYCVLECNGDWKETARQLAANGYGNDRSGKKKRFETLERWKRSENMSLEERKAEFKKYYKEAPIEEVDEHDKLPEPTHIAFWEKDKNEKIIINRVKLLELISHLGYRIMPTDLEQNQMQLIHIKDNLVSIASIQKIKADVYDYAVKYGADDAERIKDAVLGKYKIFNKEFIEFLDKIIPTFMEDTKTHAYFFYLNGVVSISKDNIELIEYGSLPDGLLIWKSEIIHRQIQLDGRRGNYNVIDGSPVIDIYPRFLYLIANKDIKRWQAILTHIGYALHKFKDKTIPVCLILAEETDSDSKGGGTGKGIFSQAIHHMIPCLTMDGKDFRSDKNFAWQRVNPETRMVIIQDVRKDFNFEAMYSKITEGMTVERKNQPEVHYPFEKSPKLMLTTNYVINNTGNHATRRQRVIPFSDYFSPSHTPMDEFKQVLFDDWTDKEWLIFDNFMFVCTQSYLENSIIEILQSDSMRFKAIKTAFGNEFKDWFKEIFHANGTDFKPFSDLYLNFLNHYGMTDQEFSRKRFRSALAKAAETFGGKVVSKNFGVNGGVCVKIEISHFSQAVDNQAITVID